MKAAVTVLTIVCLLFPLTACGKEPVTSGTDLLGETGLGEPGTAVPERETIVPEEPGYAPSLPVGPSPALDIDPESGSEPDLAQGNTTITLSFAGDVLIAQMLGQYSAGGFNDYAQTHEPEYFLEGVQDYFASDDLTVVNLENVLSDQELTPRDKGEERAFWFIGPTSYVDILTAGSVECVSVANNHTMDYGEVGYRDTIQTARDAGLAVGSNEETVYLEKGGFTVAVICNGLWNEAQAGSIASRIREAEEKSDLQIVFYHGGTEGVYEPEEWRVRASRSLVDAGADVVLGGHPHVLQPMETYDGVDILYSLGNFCYGGNRHPEDRTVIYRLTLVVSPEGELVDKQSTVIPCYVHTGTISNDFHPAVIEDAAERQLVLDFLAGEAEKPI